MKICTYILGILVTMCCLNCSVSSKSTSKRIQGTYKAITNPNSIEIDSLNTALPRNILAITLWKRRIVYAQVPYRGDNGLAKNKDGSYPKFYRRGKWQLENDTLRIAFKDGGEHLNSSFVVKGDTLFPISSPPNLIWKKETIKVD